MNLLSKKCPICDSQMRPAIFLDSTSFCSGCNVGVTLIKDKFKYSSCISQEFDSNFLDFAANRDFILFQNLFMGISNIDIKNILEIGSGYGKLGLLISKYYSHIKYYFYEENVELHNNINSFYLKPISHDDIFSEEFDLIIMNNVLEHIYDFNDFLRQLKFKYIVFYQPNRMGFIPRWLPFFWYGWSKDQHYWHFSIKSLDLSLSKLGYYRINQSYFKLPYKLNFDFKLPVKLFLSFINLFLKNSQCDAFVVIYKADSLK